MLIENRVLVSNEDLQAAEIEKLNAEKESLFIVIPEQDNSVKSDKESCKRADIHGNLDLLYVGDDSKVLRAVTACRGR